jgi:hypothetical protein
VFLAGCLIDNIVRDIGDADADGGDKDDVEMLSSKRNPAMFDVTGSMMPWIGNIGG